MSKSLRDILRRLWSDEKGQTTIEYALLLAVIGVPACAAFGWLLQILAATYGMVAYLESQPFP